MPVNAKCKLVKKEMLTEDIVRFVMQSQEIASLAMPGQFLQVKCSDTVEPLLRRPISISEIDKVQNTISMIFQMRGKGTKMLADYKEGDLVDIVGPLGWGTFEIEDKGNIAIIGGGIGIFPLLEIAKQTEDRANVYLGFRNKELITLEEDFKRHTSNLNITTDDGSYGIKGFCTEIFRQQIADKNFKMVYACGPLPMLKIVKIICEEFNLNCQISLEERMACGIGACLGCAVKINENEQEKVLHVCKDGPVFNAKDVIF